MSKTTDRIAYLKKIVRKADSYLDCPFLERDPEREAMWMIRLRNIRGELRDLGISESSIRGDRIFHFAGEGR